MSVLPQSTAGVASVVTTGVAVTALVLATAILRRTVRTAAAVAVLGGVAAGEALDHRLGLRCEGELGVAVHLLDDGVAGGLHDEIGRAHV